MVKSSQDMVISVVETAMVVAAGILSLSVIALFITKNGI